MSQPVVGIMNRQPQILRKKRRLMHIEFSEANAKLLIEAVHSNNTVTGYTHDFYNYPARFSPQFADT